MLKEGDKLFSKPYQIWSNDIARHLVTSTIVQEQGEMWLKNAHLWFSLKQIEWFIREMIYIRLN